MSRLEELRKNMLAMTPDELRAHVRQIRNDRRTLKESPKSRKAKVKGAKVQRRKATDIFAKLSPEQREALLAELEREAGNA